MTREEDLENWIKWLQVRMPELKDGAKELWIRQALEGYAKPKNKTKPLENRKDEFELKCLVVAKGDELNFLKDFVDYWTEHNEGGKKMRFEMSKNQPFNIKRRLATWKKNQKNYGTTTTKKGIDNDSLNGWINS